jgi:hypothetical protein
LWIRADVVWNHPATGLIPNFAKFLFKRVQLILWDVWLYGTAGNELNARLFSAAQKEQYPGE